MMKIFEGYFNNVESNNDEIIDDVLQQNINSDVNILLPEYQICWKPSYGSSLIEISKNNINKLRHLVDNTRYVDDCRLMISGANLYKYNSIAFNNIKDNQYKPVDFFKYQETLDYTQIKNMDDYPIITVLHFFFELKESAKSNIKYLLKVLIELSRILKTFCIINNVPNDYLSDLCFQPGWEYYTDEHLSLRLRGINGFISNFKISVTSDLYKLSNGMGNDDLYKEFNLFWSVVFQRRDNSWIFNLDDMYREFGYQSDCPKSLYNALINCGLTKKQMSLLSFSENKKMKTLDISIPINTKICFNNISLDSAMRDTKITKIRLFVEGTLIINDISDYANLKLLKGGYQHNTLVINTIVTPKLLRRLLVSCNFNTIDFTNAKVSEAVDIDMQYRLIANPDIHIITDEDNMIQIR